MSGPPGYDPFKHGWPPCPSCRGSGKTQLALDVDVLKWAWSAIVAGDYDSTHVATVDYAIQVIAALDKGAAR